MAGGDADDDRKRAISTNVVAACLIVLGVLTGVQGYVLHGQTRDLALCQQAYSNGFADALDARSAANAEAQMALDEWMQVVGDVMTAPDASSRARVQQAISDYLAKRVAARKAQAENPYPEAPRDACSYLES